MLLFYIPTFHMCWPSCINAYFHDKLEFESCWLYPIPFSNSNLFFFPLIIHRLLLLDTKGRS